MWSMLRYSHCLALWTLVYFLYLGQYTRPNNLIKAFTLSVLPIKYVTIKAV